MPTSRAYVFPVTGHEFESKTFGRLCKKTNMMIDMILIIRKEEAKLLLALILEFLLWVL